MRILLIEDDPADALLVEESLKDSDLAVDLSWIESPADLPRALAEGPRCILVDLGVPGFEGLGVLRVVLAAAGDVPVLVLTGSRDRERGLAAVGAGAGDYLVKDEVDGPTLARSIRYGIERARARSVERELLRAQLLREENLRLERSLLPRPLLHDERVRWAGRYQPGAASSVLGGDFYDTVELADGTIRLVIGDVSGHGPAEAALGVSLRIAWRTLVLNGTPDDEVLPALNVLFEAEGTDDRFCTVCDVAVPPDRRALAYRLGGHPPPLLLVDEPVVLSWAGTGLPLGVEPGTRWATRVEALPERWSLLAYTDGLVEPRLGGAELGIEGLVALVAAKGRDRWRGEGIEALCDEVMEPHRRAAHLDDVAVLGLSVEAGPAW